jgi:glycosyltransferase involved in cell wall biosynthesis
VSATRPSLAVVIPAWNEEEGIAWAIGALAEGLTELLDAGRIACTSIVVADDHSTDRTAERAAQQSSERVPVVVVPVPGGRGLGRAIRAGLAAADADIVVYTDADLPFDPHDIGRLLRVADRYQADVVCGYRFDRTVEGTLRAGQSHVYNALIRAVLPVHVRDVNFACKLLRRQVVNTVLPELTSDRSFIDAELLARCEGHGFRIAQLGVDYFPRFDTASTLGGPDAVRNSLLDLVRLWPELRRRRA